MMYLIFFELLILIAAASISAYLGLVMLCYNQLMLALPYFVAAAAFLGVAGWVLVKNRKK